jgi:hypothetical protein
VVGNALEQLTEDHRVIISSNKLSQSRTEINPQIEIVTGRSKSKKGMFSLATDGATSMSGNMAISDSGKI